MGQEDREDRNQLVWCTDFQSGPSSFGPLLHLKQRQNNLCSSGYSGRCIRTEVTITPGFNINMVLMRMAI